MADVLGEAVKGLLEFLLQLVVEWLFNFRERPVISTVLMLMVITSIGYVIWV
ncbi:hypothetical protein [Kordiimonas laminariae]|uniref:hypothetical protein n=1 Tax=Kordiimonas laminariae TaxID=2917717 RepID=UPI001FF56B11|nr:hypothetical protein [Kordiimonas laminariae]MCK0068076.1 hypothetical protein [Kordiimonas laminariae]